MILIKLVFKKTSMVYLKLYPNSDCLSCIPCNYTKKTIPRIAFWILLFCIFTCLITDAYAKFKIGIFDNYVSTPNLQLNDSLRAQDDDIRTSVITYGSYGWGVDSVWSNRYGLYCDFEIVDSLMIGTKLSNITICPYNWDWTITDGSNKYEVTSIYNANIISAEIGAVYNLKIPSTCLSMDFSAYAGFGLAYGEKIVKGLNNIPGFIIKDHNIPTEGCGLIAEITGSLNYPITSSIAFDIDFGYLFAKVSRMRLVKDVDAVNANEGDIFINAQGNPVILDFSGYVLGVKLTYEM